MLNAFSMPQEVTYASVGMSAIERFLRPVTYQNFPDELLPESLREANPLHLWPLVDGEPTRD